MGFEITLRDRTTEFVGDADTFAHEKVMTTFYRTQNARRAVDAGRRRSPASALTRSS